MFCFNCGANLPNGARFCSRCGTSLDSTHAVTQQANTVALSNYMDIETQKRNYIIELFRNIFNDSRIYGSNVYIIGKNSINPSIKSNLDNYYLEDRHEKPLLVFDYKNGLEWGFVITDHRLVWYYGRKGRQSVLLEDIKSLNPGKAVLARVLRPIDFYNVQHPEIFLDGLSEKETFIVKFTKFIDEIFYAFNDKTESDEDHDYYAVENKERRQSLDGILEYACGVVRMNDTYCIVGTPTINNSHKKYNAAIKNFNIPINDNVFLIYDATLFGSCEKGFAICSSGFYFKNSNVGYITWEQFANINISYSVLTSLKVDQELFNCSPSDGKNLSIILNTIVANIA